MGLCEGGSGRFQRGLGLRLSTGEGDWGRFEPNNLRPPAITTGGRKRGDRTPFFMQSLPRHKIHMHGLFLQEFHERTTGSALGQNKCGLI